MRADTFFSDLLTPAIVRLIPLLPGIPFDARAQVGGPAYSYWQFEELGGVAEVLQKCPGQAAAVCAAVDCPPARSEVYVVMAGNDVLATAMARLLLWQDPAPLPGLGQRDQAWVYYLRNWRPGVPRPGDWANNYGTALSVLASK